MEVLGTYSNRKPLENTGLSVLEQAKICQQKAASRKKPWRNTTPPRRRVRILTPEEVDQLLASYQAGDSTYILSRRYGIRRETVVAHLERHGIPIRANKKIVLDKEKRNTVLQIHATGWSVRRISRELRVTERVVARTLDDTFDHEFPGS